MNVLVFGKTGQLAIALSEHTGWRFLGRDEADLASPGAAARAVLEASPDWVINAAAYTSVDRAETEPALAARINAEAVGEIAAASATVGAALLQVSTDYVFDGAKPGAWREDDPTSPLGVYGRTKLAGERLALAANPRTVVLRTSWVYAPWGRNFVRTMLRLAAERPSLRIVADQRGNPTSALDLARACVRVVQALDGTSAGDPRWGVYHFAGGGSTTWADFAREILAEAAIRRLIRQIPQVEEIGTADYAAPAPRPANSTLDCGKFGQAFGLVPRPWREALAETLDRLSTEVTT